jgi:hypothetical protein
LHQVGVNILFMIPYDDVKHIVIYLFLLSILIFTGCGGTGIETEHPPGIIGTKPTPTDQTTLPPSPVPTNTHTLTPQAEIQTVLNIGIMVHLEGWEDEVNEDKFRAHAALLRQYADLFEIYGAKLTLESKEMTEGAINWNDNVLLEMENRGHAIGVHADVGGSMRDTFLKIKTQLIEMKSLLESLGVRVRHVSGVNSHCDWVTAAADAGFEFVTGVVAYALLSLPPELRPMEILDDARPGEYHESFPFELEGRLFAWRAESGLNWIYDNPDGRIVIIPSGAGIASFYEASQGIFELGGDQDFTIEDIDACQQVLDDIIAYITSSQSTQPYTYYVSWSFGKALDINLLEQWLQMVDAYVAAGQVRWQTIPDMYGMYIEWEIESGRRSG